MNSTSSKIFSSVNHSCWFDATVEPYNFASVTEAVQPIELYLGNEESGGFIFFCKGSENEGSNSRWWITACFLDDSIRLLGSRNFSYSVNEIHFV